MTQEDKSILLKDLSARSPYGVKCKVRYWDGSGRLYVTGDMTLIGIIGNTCVFKTNFIRESTMSVDISDVKPYLRPLSSMTEEEEREVGKLGVCYDGAFHNDIYDVGICMEEAFTAISWLLKRHFDINYLIQKGLALEAPEDMYKIN